jgi:uncharacterized RDD family membrane protein YckC
MAEQDQEYAGFWIRVGASLIDTLLVFLITSPVLYFFYGGAYWTDDTMIKGFWDIVISYVFPTAAVLTFWVYRSATPGKIALKLSIVDARNGSKPTTGQFIVRYLGYYVSIIPLFLGLIWVGIDKRKQGWHDKIAGTVVLRNKHNEPVRFEENLD